MIKSISCTNETNNRFMICNMMINLISIPHNFSLEYDHEGFTLFLRAWTMFYPTYVTMLCWSRPSSKA